MMTPMATFAELKSEVQTIIIDLPTAVSNLVGMLVNRAMKDLQKKHDFKVMEATSNVFVTTANSHVLGSVPSDFKKFRGRPYILHNDGEVDHIGTAIDVTAVERVYGRNDTGTIGQPAYIVDPEPDDENNTRSFQVYPLSDGNSDYSDGQYRVYVPYWKFLTNLSADGDTNWFTNNAEEYLIYRAAARGFLLDWDPENAAIWQGLATDELRTAKNTDKYNRLGSVKTLVPRLDVNAPRLRGVGEGEFL